MPQHKSAKKRNKQNQRKKLTNKVTLNKYRSSIVSFMKSIKDNDKKKSEELLRLVNSLAFKSVNKGIIKARAASRKISTLSRLLSQ